MNVQRYMEFKEDKNTTILEASLKESRSFVKDGYFIVEAYTKANRLKIDIINLRMRLISYLSDLLGTLYQKHIKSIELV
jgi:hypothetical protein